jgi:hypothetical protein
MLPPGPPRHPAGQPDEGDKPTNDRDMRQHMQNQQSGHKQVVVVASGETIDDDLGSASNISRVRAAGARSSSARRPALSAMRTMSHSYEVAVTTRWEPHVDAPLLAIDADPDGTLGRPVRTVRG